MAQSLRKRLEVRRLTELRTKLSKAESAVLLEETTAKMLVEVMSMDDLKKVSDIIDKLRSIKSPKLPVLSKAIDQAEFELNKYTGGGPLDKAWTKLKGLVGIDNPVVKITTFADALERGFSQVPTIIKNNVGDLKNIDTTKSLSSILTNSATTTGTKSDEDLGKVGKTNGPFADDPTFSNWPGMAQNEADGQVAVTGKLKNVADQMLKALAPGGIFGAFKKIPYIDTKALVQELVQAPINVIAPVIKKIQSGTHAAQIAQDMKQQITGAGEAETKADQKGAPETQAGQAQPGAPAKGSQASISSKTGEDTPPQPRGGGSNTAADQKSMQTADKVYDSIKLDFGGVDEKTVKSVLATLAHNGMLKTS